MSLNIKNVNLMVTLKENAGRQVSKIHPLEAINVCGKLNWWTNWQTNIAIQNQLGHKCCKDLGSLYPPNQRYNLSS